MVTLMSAVEVMLVRKNLTGGDSKDNNQFLKRRGAKELLLLSSLSLKKKAITQVESGGKKD